MIGVVFSKHQHSLFTCGRRSTGHRVIPVVFVVVVVVVVVGIGAETTFKPMYCI